MLFRAYWRDPPSDDWYVIGLNYPGIANSGRGGYQLGPNQIMAREGHNTDVNRVTARTLDELEEDFRRTRQLGCRVVRMWAFTQGQGLRWSTAGTDEHGEEMWRLRGIDRAFSRNITAITEKAANQGLKIYWTLFNGADFLVDTDDNPARRMKRAFHEILTDSSGGRFRGPLMRTVLPAFLDALQPHLDGVFAIDLMNEPDTNWYESVVGDLDQLYGIQTVPPWLASFFQPISGVNIEQYLGFFRECSQTIRRRCQGWQTWASDALAYGAIPLSIGCCRFHTAQNVLTAIDSSLDFYDYHHYNHRHLSSTEFLPLPDWNARGGHKPCILGECGLGGHYQQQRGVPFAQAFRRSASARQVSLRELFDAQAECIENIMTGAYERGYAGCVIWEYGKQYTDVTTAHSPYRERNLSCEANWSDRFFMIWTPDGSSHVPSAHLGAGAGGVCLLYDRPVTGRVVAGIVNDIFREHRMYDRCPPMSLT